MQKQLEGTRSILSSADRVAHIDVQLSLAIVSNTHALPAEYKCLKSNKTEQSIYECLLGSVLTTFSAPPQILASIDSFLLPNSKRRNDG